MMLGYLAILCSLLSASRGGPVNSLDQPFDFDCPNGNFLFHILSVHNNGAEDRQFTLECKNLPVASAGETCFETSWANDFDQPFDFECPTNHFVTGMASEHNNGAEDRRFKFHCCAIQDDHMLDCTHTKWVNSYDQQEDFKVPNNMVLRGMSSVHSNGAEDRIFGFEYCTIANIPSEVILG